MITLPKSIPGPDASTVARVTGLEMLRRCQLDGQHQAFLDRLIPTALGGAPWRQRKVAEAHDILALDQVAPYARFKLMELRVEEELIVVAELRGPVPCRESPAGAVVVRHQALAVFRYPQEVMTTALPGTSVARVLSPGGIFHPNFHQESGVACLGRALPRNIPLRELVWLTWSALTLQSVMADPRDAAGVLNAAAARYWVDHRQHMPLTRTGFLENAPL